LKTIKLADKLLLHLVKELKASNRQVFDFDSIQSAFPDQHSDSLVQAISLLEDDGFVNVLYADNIPYIITLRPAAIRHIEENTLLKKGYTLAKQIKDLIP